MTSRLDENLTKEATKPDFDIVSVFAERQAERYALHARHMNEMMVRVLRTIGYDVGLPQRNRAVSV
jgi:ornithine--oxo-acid transaminase